VSDHMADQMDEMRLMSAAEIEDICLTPLSKSLAAGNRAVADAFCVTLPDGSCVSEEHCMHGPPASQNKAAVTVYRNGTFSVSAPEVEGKCGVFGKTEFRFDAWFTAGEDDLDCRGFIVDNADLYRYFMKLYSVEGSPEKFVSCELMVLRAVRDWRERWPMARAIMVRVWGKEEVTYVEARWER
jgi:hypothetical protein